MVDDELSMREFREVLLFKVGYRVSLAKNGNQAESKNSSCVDIFYAEIEIFSRKLCQPRDNDSFDSFIMDMEQRRNVV